VYRGLILDFGGVVTTDFYGAMRAFGVREGLGAAAVEQALGGTEEGRDALATVEDGRLAQRDYETILAGLLGVEATGLLGRILADLRPCTPVVELVGRARNAGIAPGVLSNYLGRGVFDPYAGFDLEELLDAEETLGTFLHALIERDDATVRRLIHPTTARAAGVPSRTAAAAVSASSGSTAIAACAASTSAAPPPAAPARRSRSAATASIASSSRTASAATSSTGPWPRSSASCSQRQTGPTPMPGEAATPRSTVTAGGLPAGQAGRRADARVARSVPSSLLVGGATS
jgi:hypothetical protein